jgi:hypothetical protein
MTEDRFAHSPALRPEAATDEPAFHLTYRPRPGDPAYDPDRDFEFATEAESDAYMAGLCDGIRQGGGVVTPRLEARARTAYPELFGEPDPSADPHYGFDGGFGFDPVCVRDRHDGWTPERQRAYVDALADSGVARYAAARVGMSEQGANRLRRRADARSFDLACEAAMRHGARRLRAVAFERAIEGTVKRHYWHGELKSEERVYDNRLLVYLLGKTAHLLDEPEEAKAVAAQWEPWVEAIEHGTPPPVLDEPAPAKAGPEGPQFAPDEDDAFETGPDAFTGSEVWQEGDGSWWTGFPPPDDFDGYAEGSYGDHDYKRELTPAEAAVAEADDAAERAADLAREARRRDVYFGFLDPEDEPADGAEDFSPGEAEPCEPSAETARE